MQSITVVLTTLLEKLIHILNPTRPSREELLKIIKDLEKLYKKTQAKIDELKTLEKDRPKIVVGESVINAKLEFEIMVEEDTKNVILLIQKYDVFKEGKYLTQLNQFILPPTAAQSLSTLLFKNSLKEETTLE